MCEERSVSELFKEYREYLEYDELEEDVDLLNRIIEQVCPEQECDDWVIE